MTVNPSPRLSYLADECPHFPAEAARRDLMFKLRKTELRSDPLAATDLDALDVSLTFSISAHTTPALVSAAPWSSPPFL
jgi:hypothetical protein